MALSRSAYLILGMLKLGRRTGYEIKSRVDVSTRFFWAASYGQIYPDLRRLEQQGLIRGEPTESGGRRRRSFELSAAGEAALVEWLAGDAPLQVELRHEGLLKLFFADALEPAARVELVRAIRHEHEDVLDRLRQIEGKARAERDAGIAEMPLHVLSFGLDYHEFVVGWCRRRERELETTAEPTPERNP
jgi:DNA-binding PadR family transcriptional regulator